MSFQDEYKITNADRLDKGVYGLPDTPGMTTAAIQERFDSLGNLAIDKFNALVEAASDVVDGSDTKFPTNKAVQDYISGEGGEIIDDTTPSPHKAYSSQKVENMFGDVASRVIDDTEPSSDKTYSSEEIEEKLSNIPSPKSIIDDDTASTDTTYSSSKLESDFISVSDTEEQTATDTFSTINGGLLSSLKVSLSPNQDLHGYDHPYVGGAGKNKLPLTVDGIKSANTSGTWNGNVYSYNGVNFTLLADDANNIIGIKANRTGQSTNNPYFYLAPVAGLSIADSTNVTLSGCPDGGKWNAGTDKTYTIRGVSQNYSTTHNDVGSGISFSYDSTLTRFYIEIYAEQVVNNLIFYPMIRLSTETDPTFEPYSNICPISGHTQVEVDVSDGQTTQEQVTVNLGGTYYSGTLDVVTGVFTPDTAERDLSTLTFRSASQNRWLSEGIKAEVKHPSDSLTKIKFWSDSYYYTDAITLYFNTSLIGIAVDNEGNLLCRNKDTNPPTGHIVYELATPTPIQLSPTMVKALVGENHLSAPLDGQEITESVYSPLAKWNAVINDTTASNDTTYSSSKVDDLINNIPIPDPGCQIDDENETSYTTYSSNKILSIAGATNYSNTEHVIGTWIDGKPLYEITFDFEIPTTTTVVPHGISNLKKVVSIDGVAYKSDLSEYAPLPFAAMSGGASWNAAFEVNQTDINLELGNAYKGYYTWMIATIRYTKTTDD